jgi:hypothetical protein
MSRIPRRPDRADITLVFERAGRLSFPSVGRRNHALFNRLGARGYARQSSQTTLLKTLLPQMGHR